MIQPKPPALDAVTRAALAKLADISVTEPTPWIPHTWGWAVVGMGLLATVLWLVIRSVRRHRANRYRSEALADLAAIESQLIDDAGRAAAMSAIPALLKRVALAAWPRPDVAALSGDAWITFLRAHGGRSELPDPAAQLVRDLQYRTHELEAMSPEDATRIADQIRGWIKGHHVRP